MTKGCKLEEDPSVKFPFPCTLGDVLKPKYVVDGLDVGKAGKVHIREHSFMENPRTPEKVKVGRGGPALGCGGQRLLVQPCAGCALSTCLAAGAGLAGSCVGSCVNACRPAGLPLAAT